MFHVEQSAIALNDATVMLCPPASENVCLSGSVQGTGVGRVFIYTLSDPRSGLVRYVGKANNPAQRLKLHLRDKTPSRKRNWLISLKNLGLNPRLEILEETTDSEWQEAERFWIVSLRFMGCSLTNMDNGGTGAGRWGIEFKDKQRARMTGREIGEATRKKMGAWQIGRKLPESQVRKMVNAMTGRKGPESQKEKLRSWHKSLTPEQKEKRRIEQCARRHSVETKIKMRGRKHTPEELEKMRARNIGRTFSKETIEKMRLAAQRRSKQKP